MKSGLKSIGDNMYATAATGINLTQMGTRLSAISLMIKRRKWNIIAFRDRGRRQEVEEQADPSVIVQQSSVYTDVFQSRFTGHPYQEPVK